MPPLGVGQAPRPGGAFSRLRLPAHIKFACKVKEGNGALGGRVRNLPEAPSASGLIVSGTDGFKNAAGKIIIRDAGPAGRTEVSSVDH
jgi:hypothetical protein